MTIPPSPTAKERRAIAELTAKLAHDVGKYLVRCARNLDPLPSAPLAPALLAMLLADLYGPTGQPDQGPRVRFQQLWQALPASYSDPRLRRCAELFSQLRDLAEPLARGELAAIAQAVRTALAIETDLRTLAQESQAAARRPISRGRR